MIGTWYGFDIQTPITFYNQIFHEDGLVEILFTNGQYSSSKVVRLIEVNKNLYRYELAESRGINGLSLGNLGGVGVKYDFGVYISSDSRYIEPVVFSALEGEDFEYEYISESSIRMYQDLETLRSEGVSEFKTDSNFLNKDTKYLTKEEVTDWD